MTIKLLPHNFNIPCETSKSKKGLHVEDTDGTQGTRLPLLHVAFHGRLHRVCKLADDGDGPGRPGQVTFLVSIDGLLEDEQGGDYSERGVKPCCGPCRRGKDRGDGDVVERQGGGGGHGGLGGVVLVGGHRRGTRRRKDLDVGGGRTSRENGGVWEEGGILIKI